MAHNLRALGAPILSRKREKKQTKKCDLGNVPQVHETNYLLILFFFFPNGLWHAYLQCQSQEPWKCPEEHEKGSLSPSISFLTLHIV